MTLSFQVNDAQDGEIRLQVTGEIDLGTAPVLRDTITTTLQDRRPKTLVLDLDGVAFLDSTGIAALINGRHLADAFGSVYQVVNIRDGVRWVLKIAGVLSYLGDGDEMTSTP